MKNFKINKNNSRGGEHMDIYYSVKPSGTSIWYLRQGFD